MGNWCGKNALFNVLSPKSRTIGLKNRPHLMTMANIDASVPGRERACSQPLTLSLLT